MHMEMMPPAAMGGMDAMMEACHQRMADGCHDGAMPPAAMAVWMLHDGNAPEHGGWTHDGSMPADAMGGMGPMHMEMMPPAAMGGMDAPMMEAMPPAAWLDGCSMMEAMPPAAMAGMDADMMAACHQRQWPVWISQ